MKSKSTLPTFTYQTRIILPMESELILDACASYFSMVERKLFAEIAAGKKASELKSSYLTRFGLTARQFNAIRVQVEGKISSIKERRASLIEEMKLRISKLDKKIHQLRKQKNKIEIIHQKKRRRFNLQCKLDKQIADHEKGKVRLCFGSKKSFLAQFDLEANGFNSLSEWLADWKQKRNDSFFLLGSKDETSGNQSCIAIMQDNQLKFHLRLPDALSKFGKYLIIPNVQFKYGSEAILASLRHCDERKVLHKANDPSYKNSGQAISYRFKKDKKGWIVFLSTSLTEPTWITNERLGAIGVDINADHLAIVETDRYGNPIKNKILPLNCYGKTSDQAKALIGDAVAELVQWSIITQKPLVVEKLDFQQKKTELEESGNKKYARMLSSFAYNSILDTIKSRAWRFGVQVKEVNPAFTSIIGRVKFANRYGLTIHESAALVIARRYQRVSERLPRCLDKIPDSKDGHVTCSLPVRNRGQHVWTSWRKINRKLSVVLAAHFRAKRKDPRSRCNPLPVMGTSPPVLVGAIPTHEPSITLLD